MVKVITYGSFDFLHYGHIRLLKRAKELGDYLIVGVTSDDYDKMRGKINLQQSLMERIEAVRATGIVDEIIIEEYEGQKIDDIKRYNVDVFAIGSDWEGHFDYLKDYCEVVYLTRTEGVSSSEIREKKCSLRLGMVGDSSFLNKIWKESKAVNGISVEALCTSNMNCVEKQDDRNINFVTDDYEEMLEKVDAVYIRSLPDMHDEHIRQALDAGKHILCESPLLMNELKAHEILQIAHDRNLVLMEAIKTAYATAYNRLLLLIKAGKIGEVISVDSTCTSIRNTEAIGEWNNIHEWGPTALLPVLQIMGTDYIECDIATRLRDENKDDFTKINLLYANGVASIKIGDRYKAEGDLIVSGSKGYIYVPSPWWKTDYFEIRYENPADNKRYFYQLDGEGIRYELVAFVRAIEQGRMTPDINRDVTLSISRIMERFERREKLFLI